VDKMAKKVQKLKCSECGWTVTECDGCEQKITLKKHPEHIICEADGSNHYCTEQCYDAKFPRKYGKLVPQIVCSNCGESLGD